jgi:hypothetical protein
LSPCGFTISFNRRRALLLLPATGSACDAWLQFAKGTLVVRNSSGGDDIEPHFELLVVRSI